MLTTIVHLLFAAAVGITRPAAAPPLGEVLFTFDSSELSSDATARLDRVVSYANAHPDARIVLDAHCDPIGTQAYNVGLAIRRAEAVRGTLTARGVDADQIVLAIYGEAGARRTSYAADRRVTAWPTRAPLARVIRSTFAGDGTAVTWERPRTLAEIASNPVPVALRYSLGMR